MATPIPSPPPTTTQTQPQPPSSASTSKTPVSLHPQSHLDPSAYVRGHNSIQIGPSVLIHPRAHLLSLHSALTIAEGSIVSEKSVIGGPLPLSSIPATNTNASQGKTTELGIAVHIHPNVTVNAGARVGDYAVLEANVVVGHGVSVGKHSKVCAGVVVERDVPDWTVVHGSRGERRRARKKGGEAEGDVVEAARVQMMGAERDATMVILKKAAARSVGASKGRR